MREFAWPQRSPPDPGADPARSWTGEPETPLHLGILRRELRVAALAGLGPADATDDDVDGLLLAVEELTSNALRHGRPPARVTVTVTPTGWLVDVSDAAPERPPTPAIGRDPALGGLGLHLVDRLCDGHGWLVDGGRKHVWAHLVCAAAQPPGGVAARLRNEAALLAAALPNPATVCVPGRLDDLREDVVSDLFTALRGALANVTRHAHARTADVTVTVTAGVLTLRVVDDGVGIQGARPDVDLADLTRRATWHGGSLSVEPGPAGGTAVTWTVCAPRRPELRTPDGSSPVLGQVEDLTDAARRLQSRSPPG
jgi:anti-sigma regulatory factor (Ser/Thr protein kinase)